MQKLAPEKNKINIPPELRISREYKPENTIVNVKGNQIGNGAPHFVIGPCAVESYEQMKSIGEKISDTGLTLLRGGAYKPRTSPYDFQGMGVEGLKVLKSIGMEYNLGVISEILSINHLDEALDCIDVIQIGARNMHNFELLKAIGQLSKPVLLKRGLSATIKEFKYAAEYILSEGNENVILCERGIRTYEPATRNTLDISAVPILKKDTHLPVMVDITHSTGRKDIITSVAKAAIAVGADGIMAEVHPDPLNALSDSKQQMDFNQLDEFMIDMLEFVNAVKHLKN
ncbi:3-deoxy-D-arabinoheptulosonate-7-phosphate synthase [Halobacillus karajensis]|nr:3-deoxy-D-arabinoheptulosonate-7-phosphate synthase [Halobacillus karajensis]